MALTNSAQFLIIFKTVDSLKYQFLSVASAIQSFMRHAVDEVRRSSTNKARVKHIRQSPEPSWASN